MDQNQVSFDIKQNAPVSDAKAIGRNEVYEPLHIAGQILAHSLDFSQYPSSDFGR